MRARRKRVAVAAICVLLFSLIPMSAMADPRESTNSVNNPDLTKACGLDVLMILD